MKMSEAPQYRVQISPVCHAEMKRHAEDSFPEECCGSMLGRERENGVREIVRVIPAHNTKDENRKRRFLIGPDVMLAAEKAARAASLDVLGIYHSHPNHPSQTSDFDRDHAWPFYSYLIVSCIDGKAAQVQSWRLRDDRSQFDEETLL